MFVYGDGRLISNSILSSFGHYLDWHLLVKIEDTD